jgi:hypothetical protein
MQAGNTCRNLRCWKLANVVRCLVAPGFTGLEGESRQLHNRISRQRFVIQLARIYHQQAYGATKTAAVVTKNVDF